MSDKASDERGAIGRVLKRVQQIDPVGVCPDIIVSTATIWRSARNDQVIGSSARDYLEVVTRLHIIPAICGLWGAVSNILGWWRSPGIGVYLNCEYPPSRAIRSRACPGNGI